ncbi:HTH-type transcriptional regulator protein ptxE [Dorcoceras hygrometricum]|nr:HTH-type transcriptional regulator protein ptxE [Dorcoceras hygrometricum]
MGNCGSCEPTRAAATVKLILLNGQLQEFSYPVKVSTLVQHAGTVDLDRFICSSDDIDIGEELVAVAGGEELRPGELYFELPSRWRDHRLQAEDMAALAMKASLALGGHVGDKVSCSCYALKRVHHASVVVLNEKERPFLVAGGGGGNGRGGGCGRFKVAGKFLPKLNPARQSNYPTGDSFYLGQPTLRPGFQKLSTDNRSSTTPITILSTLMQRSTLNVSVLPVPIAPYASAPFPSLSGVPLLLKDAILRLHNIGYEVVSTALALAELKSMTIFAFDDISIFTGEGCTYLSSFLHNVVPNKRLTARIW